MKANTRILVVEDDAPSLELVVYLLNESGYTVVSATNGKTGLEVAQRERPDLIVCDINLPKLDGYGVIRRLKDDQALKDIPVVAVTALAMMGDRSKILSAGFDGYITKPIEPETFVREVTYFLPADQRPANNQNGETKAEASLDKPVSSTHLGITILVVDDTPENIEFARSALEPSGFKVIAAKGVQEAIALVEKDKAHLVLCDLHMLPHSGYDLLEIAVAHPRLKRIPIVIISSTFTDDRARLECLERGAAHFIKRPIEPQALIAEITALAQAEET